MAFKKDGTLRVRSCSYGYNQVLILHSASHFFHLLRLGHNDVGLALSDRLERLLKVGDDVVDVLRADRDADEVLCRARRGLLLIGELLVRRGPRAVNVSVISHHGD